MILPARKVAAADCQLNWEAVARAAGLPGEIKLWALSTAPDRWMICDGSALADPSPLRAKLLEDGSPFGSSGGNPLIPDLRGRVPAGVDGGAGRLPTSNTLAAAAGASSVTLTTAEMPSHDHGGATGTGTTGGEAAHSHVLTYTARYVPAVSGSVMNNYETSGAHGSSSTGAPTASHAHSVPALSISAQGGGGAHENRQPYLVVNFIIFLG